MWLCCIVAGNTVGLRSGTCIVSLDGDAFAQSTMGTKFGPCIVPRIGVHSFVLSHFQVQSKPYFANPSDFKLLFAFTFRHSHDDAHDIVKCMCA